jgi:peptidoglycan-associated lipoprotein
MLKTSHRAAAVMAALVLVAGCGGSKRKPAVTTDPARPVAPAARPMPEATPLPEPMEPGPEVQPLPEDGSRLEDFSVSDPSGEGGPLEDVHFAYDQAQLGDQARAILERHALWLQNHRSAKVAVEGHCDERGTVDYNLALGEQRARAARDYLVSLGVAGDRLTSVSYGKEKPLDPASNEAAWAKNRRAHFMVTR